MWLELWGSLASIVAALTALATWCWGWRRRHIRVRYRGEPAVGAVVYNGSGNRYESNEHGMVLNAPRRVYSRGAELTVVYKNVSHAYTVATNCQIDLH